MTLEYKYIENLSIEEINTIFKKWEIIDVEILETATPQFSVFAKKGFQEKVLIENSETGRKFWLDKTFTYGDSIIIIFLTIFLFSAIGIIIYNFLFKKNA